ncbi:DUF3237 domain-containing protein [Novosphingobium arvoryzae]|uniref:DUF3237 domain-containing protein n=1 Tax=Novosphingobium arvoryzae TaxID=1256514 RepID=UPI0035B0E5FE
MKHLLIAAALALATLTGAAQAEVPPGAAAPAPTLTYVFSIRADLDPPIEVGTVDGGRRRFIGIRGGEVYGPRLQGTVMAGGGDWQTIMPEGLTKVEARYFLKSADGTVIEVTNPGVRVASVEVVEKLARGEVVDPSLYYFRTTPNFKVNGGPLDWMQRHAFVARGIRKPDSVVIDYYVVN